MRLREIVEGVAVIAVAAVAFGAFAPDRVASFAPALGPAARLANSYLPPAFGGPGGAANFATPAAPARPPVSVVLAPAERKDAPWRIDEIGTVQTIASVALRTHFDAAVTKVLIADGAEVKAGERLIELDDRQPTAQLEGAKAQLAKDQAQLDQAQRDVTRYTDLVARAATPTINLDNARTATASAQAAILADKAAIDNLAVQLAWAKIDAPISGRVGVVAIREGNIAKAGDNSTGGVFATINQMSPIYVNVPVAQSLLPALREAMRRGAAVTATPQGGKTGVAGKLALIDNAVDPTTGTIVAHAIFDNADETLWPGQLCDLTITLGVDRNVVVVPREAIQVGQDGNFVFVVADGVAHVRKIEVGRTQSEGVLVAKGLDGGEQVVVDGALLLVEGSAVDIRQPQKGAS